MSSTDPAHRIGVWRAVGRLGDYKLKQLLWPEGLPALILGAGGAFLITRATDLPARTGAAGDLVALSGALLAVVFAALAIVVSIPSSSYLRAMAQTPNGGVRRFLDPFLVAVGTQVAILLLALAYRLVAAAVPWRVEHAAFYVVGFLFVYGLLDVCGLARSLVRHGVLRSLIATTREDAADPDQNDVHRLDDRRGSR